MVQWYWIIVALFVGVIFGIFLIAFMEISKQEDENNRKWWNDGV